MLEFCNRRWNRTKETEKWGVGKSSSRGGNHGIKRKPGFYGKQKTQRCAEVEERHNSLESKKAPEKHKEELKNREEIVHGRDQLLILGKHDNGILNGRRSEGLHPFDPA